MEYNILSAVDQAPVLVVFVWYAWKNNREWRKYLTERNNKLENSLNHIADKMEKLVNEIVKK